MRYIIIILIFVTLLSCPVSAQKVDPIADYFLLTTQLIDWNLTLQIKDRPELYETNPILGKNPSDDEINLYFVSYIVITQYISKLDLNGKKAVIRDLIIFTLIIDQIDNINKCLDDGIQFKFNFRF